MSKRCNPIAVIARGAGFVRRIAWKEREVRDGAAILTLCAAISLVAHFYDLPPKVFQFAIDHADWEIDDALFIGGMLSVALLVYVIRRHQDLVHEIRAREGAEAESRRLARHDPLTGLPNRRHFSETLDRALEHAQRYGWRIGVVLVDLDGFKSINDTHGHGTGDAALVEVAARLRSCLRGGAVAARVGGDEFAIVVPDLEHEDMGRLANRIVRSFADPFLVQEASLILGASIGICTAPDHATTREEAIRRADLALYRAKADGRSLVRFFEPEMDKQAERRNVIRRELREAIASRSVRVHYQPLVAVDTKRVIAFEALARWSSPTLGEVAPGEFIAVAEEAGLIAELSELLLRSACQTACSWPAHIALSFNISPVELRDQGLGLRILAVLGETGLAPSRLEIEITESAIVADVKGAKQIIDGLRSAGVRIALDDFGTGYATMSQLLSLRFDKIKIDRSFIERLGRDPDCGVIVRATIDLANGLGLATTAEGVETADQLASLQADGCVEAQGFLFGRGIPEHQIPALLGVGDDGTRADEPARRAK